MSTRFALFCVCLAISDAFLISDIEEWREYKKQHGKHYDSFEDDVHHFRIFVDHKHKIDEHNQEFENGIASFKMGFNKYSDMKHEDFVKRMNGYDNSHASDDTSEEIDFYTSSNITLPKLVDWRKHGAVTNVKDQGQCGSCYTFAATGVLESHYFIKNGKLVSLSEQNILDCSEAYGNHGCNGGITKMTFEYVRDKGGIDTEQSYPYDGRTGYCRKTFGIDSGVRVQGFVAIPYGDEHKLQEVLATVGPVAVSIDASQRSFQSYQSGIYYEPYCSSYLLDHAVLVVGYGTDKHQQDYYIVKNSWGPSWGENGYFRIARNHMNHCGIATRAVYPIVKKAH